MKSNRDVEAEFANQIKRYLKHYEVIDSDLGTLIKTGATDIKQILDLSKSVGLKRAERIANVFGLTYYEFGNPSFHFPRFKDLPNVTQELFLKRKEKGVQPVNRTKNLNLRKHIDDLINKGALNSPKTAKQMLVKLPKEVQELIKNESRRISDLLGRNEDVMVVGKSGRHNIYQLKKFVEG